MSNLPNRERAVLDSIVKRAALEGTNSSLLKQLGGWAGNNPYLAGGLGAGGLSLLLNRIMGGKSSMLGTMGTLGVLGGGGWLLDKVGGLEGIKRNWDAYQNYRKLNPDEGFDFGRAWKAFNDFNNMPVSRQNMIAATDFPDKVNSANTFASTVNRITGNPILDNKQDNIAAAGNTIKTKLSDAVGNARTGLANFMDNPTTALGFKEMPELDVPEYPEHDTSTLVGKANWALTNANRYNDARENYLKIKPDAGKLDQAQAAFAFSQMPKDKQDILTARNFDDYRQTATDNMNHAFSGIGTVSNFMSNIPKHLADVGFHKVLDPEYKDPPEVDPVQPVQPVQPTPPPQ